MKYVYGIIAIAVLSSVCFVIPFGDSRLQKIVDRLYDYNKKRPHEKIFVHTDKETYHVGENIWLAAYCLDAYTHRFDTTSSIVYVEFINTQRQISQTLLLKNETGGMTGSFKLSDSLPAGVYQLRAYTNRMRNFDNAYFFTKNIQLRNNDSTINRWRGTVTSKQKRKLERKADDVNILFTTESGTWVKEIPNRCVVKTTNSLNEPISCNGYVQQGKQTLITFQTDTNGIATFDIIPEQKIKYQIVVNYNNKKTTRQLPQVQKQGFSMRVDHWNNSRKTITVYRKMPILAEDRLNDVLLLAHARGTVYFAHARKPQKDTAVFEIDVHDIPAGISHLTVFDGYGKQQCERIVYEPERNPLEIQLESKLKNDSVQFVLETPQKKTNGIVSLAFTKGYDMASSPNISQYLLLNAEIANDVPIYATTEYINNALILQSWRRFTWSQVFNDSLVPLKYPTEKSIVVSGQITKLFFNIPSRRANVTLTVLNQYNDYWQQTADDKGRFRFENINYYDTIDILIEARNIYKRKNIVIITDEQAPPKVQFANDVFLRHLPTRFFWQSEPIPVSVQQKAGNPNSLHSQADNIVYFDDNTSSSYGNVLQALKGKIPGLDISDNPFSTNASIRGQGQPLFLLDDMPVDASMLNSIPLSDVERVEVLKSPSQTAIYGKRGQNGVIAVYTKRGQYSKNGELNIQVLGFHQPLPFVQHPYPNRYNNLPQTVYWQGNIVIKEGKASITIKNNILNDAQISTIQGISSEGDAIYFQNTLPIK